MKRAHLIIALLLFTMVFTLALAPASIIGAGAYVASNGLWDLADARGTLWHGHGVVAGRLEKGKRLVALPPLDWTCSGFSNAALVFQLSSSGQPIGQLQVGLYGLRLDVRALSMQAKEITPLLPGALSKGEWQGLLVFRQVALTSNWQTLEATDIDMEWLNATTSLIAKGQLGSFVLKGHSEQQGVSFSITSHEGPLVLTGQGTHSRQQGFQFDGALVDNVGLVNQFPGFFGDYLQPTGAQNHYGMHVSKLNL